jgi:hypothetical protein
VDGKVDYVNCGEGSDTTYVNVEHDVDPAQATVCEYIFEATEVTVPPSP